MKQHEFETPYNLTWAQSILNNTSRQHVIELLEWWQRHGPRVHGQTIANNAMKSLKYVLKTGVKNEI